ncbi:MAG: histidine ammonia-lyase [Bryobacterales bacterium]|nr:histidine ammonia-lyase [Bryobacteraceae bacterium]MDW8356145.1 histidine ammonia-lyase [Bryobacterales bacterium]
MVLLDGESLTLEQMAAVARGHERVGIAPEARERMLAARAAVERLAAAGAPVYGVNTGVGHLADVRIAPDELAQLQKNILRSHACGVGEPLSQDEVRAMMLVRANVLAKGLSGIRPVVAERLCELLNRGVTPVVPSRGSVGASGDLAPLAHMALVLIGEGEAEYAGERVAGAEALRRAGLAPLELEAKEGISLVNGTQATLAVGGLKLLEADVLVDAADFIGAMTVDALRGTPRAFDARLCAARPHPGQARSAANMAALLEASEIRASHLACGRVQDAYSLRCAPQVHGAVRDVLAEARRIFTIELNAATDNPLVFGEEVLSGGNFHGQPLAFALDSMAMALTALAAISERRVNRLVNPALNEDLPAFLASRPGLESGLMMVQVTAAALVAENRTLATPASVGSIPTSGDKEDFVSMGMTAALKLKSIVANTRSVLAIELLAAARALDLLRPLRSGPQIEAAREELRQIVPPWEHDRPLSDDIARAAAWIASGALKAG